MRRGPRSKPLPSARARSIGDERGEWKHLERAHILSQPMAGPHVRTHVAMLGAARAAP